MAKHKPVLCPRARSKIGENLRSRRTPAKVETRLDLERSIVEAASAAARMRTMHRSRPSQSELRASIASAKAFVWLIRCVVVLVAATSSLNAFAQEKVVLAEELEVRGMDCVPQVTEVETRRPIPFVCQTEREVAGVELRYRVEGAGSKWEKLEFEQVEAGFSATIPCAATGRTGTLKVYIFARNEDRKVVARVGRNTAPMLIKLVESSELPPPALPNKEPPDRCFSKSECPVEMIGTAACPGTSKGKATKGGWGAGCGDSSQCQDGLACVAGSCETPPKCETPDDCPSGGECTDGVCHYPTKEEIDSRLGEPKVHWAGLHFGVDISMLRSATGVCGGETEDSKDYACYKGGDIYTGVPNDLNAGAVASGVHLATFRVLLSYDFLYKRFLFGGRAGWAFRGTPKDFSPIHVEGRAMYSLRKGPENNYFRPYLGLAGGYGQVDTPVTVKVLDCSGAADPATGNSLVEDCKNASTTEEIALMRSMNGAVDREFDAYHQGGAIFFGPAFSMWFMFSNESALVFNVNVMLPNVVIQPSLGYAMGI
jgi:hypothetical protein